MNVHRLLLICALCLAAPSVPACDTDADCGAGGTCIKRERRASGVCYGRAPRGAAPATDTAPASDAVPADGAAEVAPVPVTGELRERAKHWLGDPDTLLRENLPGKEVGGICMVTQDCPAGFECVIAGFEGRCVKL